MRVSPVADREVGHAQEVGELVQELGWTEGAWPCVLLQVDTPQIPGRKSSLSENVETVNDTKPHFH